MRVSLPLISTTSSTTTTTTATRPTAAAAAASSAATAAALTGAALLQHDARDGGSGRNSRVTATASWSSSSSTRLASSSSSSSWTSSVSSAGGGGDRLLLLPTFVYGTLMSSQVMETLIGRTLEEEDKKNRIRPAVLLNNPDQNIYYSRHPVRAQVFPAVVERTLAGTTAETAAPSSTKATATTTTTTNTTSSLLSKSSAVNGLLLPSDLLSQKEMNILDYFESDESDRRRVQVVVGVLPPTHDGSGGGGDDEHSDHPPSDEPHPRLKDDLLEVVDAYAYVWRRSDLTTSCLQVDQEWSFDEFQRRHLEWYLRQVVRPCRQEIEQLGMT
mmetsp:Transcript_18157/g.43895  ORF Transcript_18157/g.43895 Transcript_18157/m.43895 type:complete len:329 (-) Transcript_18157:105-1091(-)|eukprot:CAMPEP_0113474798 /NCGR_PEP_ID=MMETSP0014_2-20120614/18780_1 /TAXON_ID=2857 /ORGANISM="Nitzschia sp." /LENGTH=328 /DNA_ID=CAMNT_0000367677 /DNA_START=189 /DNA_END=1175 /DNA_ORIENTATION=- /assembly_acc=CAM_ASM_000159